MHDLCPILLRPGCLRWENSVVKLDANGSIRLPVKHAENNVFQVGSSGIDFAIAILAQLFQAAGESEYVRNGNIKLGRGGLKVDS